MEEALDLSFDRLLMMMICTLYICLWGWIQREVYKIKLDTTDELLASILGAAARKKKREDQLRRTTRYLSTGVANCVEVEGGIFRKFIVNCDKFRHFCATNLLFKHYTKIKLKSTVNNISFFVAIHNACVFVDSNSRISVTVQN